MTTVLIIDDDDSMCHALTRTVRRMGYEAQAASTLTEGRHLARHGAVDAVFLDVRLPDGNGLTLLPELAALPSGPEVIIITGAGDPDGAELAITNGAWDYIEKTDSIRKITLTLQRALDFRKERQDSLCPPVKALRREAIVGESLRLSRSLDLVAQSSASDMNVLITGETGTGKELFARAIHENSSRAAGPFVTVDCAALPETLVESILFGHSKGAFTGADKNQSGLVMQAHGGTLFLDEIGELPATLQKAFLRVLQERTIRPLGSREELHSDFRLVAATNRDLDSMVRDGLFRNDLLYRVRTMHIDIPPLHERKEDLRALASHHIDRICQKQSGSTKALSTDFLETLKEYNWPGNVRELVHTVEHAVAAATTEPTLFSKHLPPSLRAAVTKRRILPEQEGMPDWSEHATSQPSITAFQDDQLAARSLEDFPPMQEYREQIVARAEKHYLINLLQITERNMKEAIRCSGLSQSRLYALLKKYDLNTLPR